MARPKEFDAEHALEIAKGVFWEKGYESTSTEDLRLAMGIGRQSFYDTFKGKHEIFLAALERYIDRSFADAVELLHSASSPLAGITRLFATVTDASAADRARGCFGVSSMCELGQTDESVRAVGERSTKRFVDELGNALRRAKERGEVRADLHERDAAAHLHATFVGMRVLAKGGARPEMLRSVAKSALGSLRQT